MDYMVVHKRKRKRHEQHGGSWKVALADFAIAMMAFFLLMWILNAATQDQRRMVSGYFERPEDYTPTSDNSPAIILLDDSKKKDIKELKDLKSKDIMLIDTDELKKALEKKELDKMKMLKEQIETTIEATRGLREYKDQIYIDITSEGLRIQIFDSEKKEMFTRSSWTLQRFAFDILTNLAGPINIVDNKISITGHTDGNPYLKGDMTNWELSAFRANAARQALLDGGLYDDKVSRVVGLGATSLINKKDPGSPINRRISIIVLNKKTQEGIEEQSKAPEGLIIPPSTDDNVIGNDDEGEVKNYIDTTKNTDKEDEGKVKNNIDNIDEIDNRYEIDDIDNIENINKEDNVKIIKDGVVDNGVDE